MIYGLKIVGAHSSVQPIPAPIWASLCLKLFYPAPRGAFRLLLRRLFTFFVPQSFITDGWVSIRGLGDILLCLGKVFFSAQR